MRKLTLFGLLLMAEILNSLVLLQTKLTCAFKRGCLMSRNWPYTQHYQMPNKTKMIQQVPSERFLTCQGYAHGGN